MDIQTNILPKAVCAEVKALLLENIPNLNAFALSLVQNPDQAEDLVQTTLLKAWKNIDSYEPGTQMRAWLFTILRNTHYSNYRKGRWETEWSDGLDNDISVSTGFGEGGVVAREDFRRLDNRRFGRRFRPPGSDWPTKFPLGERLSSWGGLDG